MMLRAQFGEPQAQHAASLPMPLPSKQFGLLLGNDGIQEIATEQRSYFGEEVDWLKSALMRTFTAARPQSKLAFLKSQQFRAEGREQRVRASLAALDAPQPIILTVQQWKDVAEEIADED